MTSRITLTGVLFALALTQASVSPETAASSERDPGQAVSSPRRNQGPGRRRPPQSARPVTGEAALRARAERLHRQSIVIDTHNDVTSAILNDGFDLAMRGDDPARTQKTHTDLRRLKEGGVNAEFFAIYVGSDYVNRKPEEGGGAARRALDMIDIVYEQVRRHPETLEMAYTVADIRRIARTGKIAALMGIEGGHAIEDSLHALRMFYRLGIRYMTLTHSNTNNWADSEGDLSDPRVRHHNGLTEFGREVVREMNRLGMMVDISHVSDKTFYDVIEVTRAPVIASHSSARAIADHSRNMTDDMLRAVGRNGGVVMVNFYDHFIDPKKAPIGMEARKVQAQLRDKFPNQPDRIREEMAKWRAERNPGKTQLSVLLDHFDHIVKVAGVDHVGIGADFDGIPYAGLPEGMEDISKLPNLTFELVKRGYSDQDIKKILGENLLRVMAEAERVARK